MSNPNAQHLSTEAGPEPDLEDWWATGKPEGVDLGRVVSCQIDLNTQTMWVATTTHDVRVVAYDDLRPEEVPRLESPVVHLGGGQVVLLSQVGTWNVMDLADGDCQRGALDEVIPQSARLAAQRGLLVTVVVAIAIMAKMMVSATATTGDAPEQALLQTVELATTLVTIGAAVLLWKRIWPWFAAESGDHPAALTRVSKPEQRRRARGLVATPTKRKSEWRQPRKPSGKQRDWIAELDNGMGQGGG